MAVQVAGTISVVLLIWALVEGFKRLGHKIWIYAIGLLALTAFGVALWGRSVNLTYEGIGYFTPLFYGYVMWLYVEGVKYWQNKQTRSPKRKKSFFG